MCRSVAEYLRSERYMFNAAAASKQTVDGDICDRPVWAAWEGEGKTSVCVTDITIKHTR